MKKKIKIDDSTYKELVELMSVGMMLQEAGKTITKRAENMLSTLATYGVEAPQKRIKRLTKENSKSIKWINFD